jgi:hypothetical protein
MGLLLGLAGLAAGFLAKDWRKETAYLSVWIIVPILGFSLLPPKNGRYILLLAPAFLLAIAVGIRAVGRFLPRIRPKLKVALLAGVFTAAGLSAAAMRVPVRSGIREVAVYLREHAPADAVLYDGYNDGVFGFYVRSLDPSFQRRIVLGQELLYHYGPGNTFQWVEHSNAFSPDDVVQLVRTQSGCRWLAVEIGPYSESAQGQRLLRRAVSRPDFEKVRSFPVTADGTSRIDLYRVVGPVVPVEAVNLKYLPFSDRVLGPIEPVKR